jgi:hypothetical protein
MIKSMGSNEVHNWHHNFHNMFKLQSSPQWLLVDYAVKFHIKFGILFALLLPNSTHQTYFLSQHKWSPACFHARVLAEILKINVNTKYCSSVGEMIREFPAPKLGDTWRLYWGIFTTFF